jgi:hypothetical protein
MHVEKTIADLKAQRERIVKAMSFELTLLPMSEEPMASLQAEQTLA